MKHIESRELDPSELEIDPVNERVSNVNPYSEDGESLQESVEELGVIEPVVVREVDGEYKVVAGQRRTLAAQAAEGVDTIPARIMEMDDTEARIVSIAENAEQFKKEVSPEDRAVAIKELLNDGHSAEEIASRMGTTDPTVRRWAEPALDYWEDTVFDAESEDEEEKDIGVEDISLRALQIIRQNTSNRSRRERIGKKVVQHNIKNKLVKEAAERSASGAEFEKEIDRTIKELESDILRIREEAYFSGEDASKLDQVMKERGISEQEAIESLVEERLRQLDYAEKDRWIGLYLESDVSDALNEAIGDRDLQLEALIKVIIKKKLRETGYLNSEERNE